MLRFKVRSEFLKQYPVQTAGSSEHREYWIPAADLPRFNRNIVGEIELVASFGSSATHTIGSSATTRDYARISSRMKLQYEILLPEFMEMAWIRHRSSIRWIIGICIGIIGLILGGIFYLDADRWFGIFLVIISVLLLLMQFVVPSFAFRRVYRRNPRMFGSRTVTITNGGISSDHQLGRSESSWNNYEKFQETARSFLLYQSADLIGIVPKRAFSGKDELQEFKALLAAKTSQS